MRLAGTVTGKGLHREVTTWIGGVTHYSLAGARLATVTDALAAIDSRIGAGAATPNHVLSVSPGWPAVSRPTPPCT